MRGTHCMCIFLHAELAGAWDSMQDLHLVAFLIFPAPNTSPFTLVRASPTQKPSIHSRCVARLEILFAGITKRRKRGLRNVRGKAAACAEVRNKRRGREREKRKTVDAMMGRKARASSRETEGGARRLDVQREDRHNRVHRRIIPAHTARPCRHVSNKQDQSNTRRTSGEFRMLGEPIQCPVL